MAITLVMFGVRPRDFCTWASSGAAGPVAVAGSIGVSLDMFMAFLRGDGDTDTIVLMVVMRSCR